MKRYIKFAAILSLLLLYCFAISQYSGAIAYVQFSTSSQNSTDNQSYISLIANDLAINSNQNESYARTLNHPPVNQLKNQANGFLSCTPLAELLHTNQYTRYQHFAKNQIDCYRPLDIIFPAHYFW